MKPKLVMILVGLELGLKTKKKTPTLPSPRSPPPPPPPSSRPLLGYTLKKWTRHNFIAPIPPYITTPFAVRHSPTGGIGAFATRALQATPAAAGDAPVAPAAAATTSKPALPLPYVKRQAAAASASTNASKPESNGDEMKP
ncbi:hypothetical protein HC256_003555 [Beauveria bassiana]|nr:hypothetical protein HC256_003555 [Beauveria bassiana]